MPDGRMEGRSKSLIGLLFECQVQNFNVLKNGKFDASASSGSVKAWQKATVKTKTITLLRETGTVEARQPRKETKVKNAFGFS